MLLRGAEPTPAEEELTQSSSPIASERKASFVNLLRICQPSPTHPMNWKTFLCLLSIGTLAGCSSPAPTPDDAASIAERQRADAYASRPVSTSNPTTRRSSRPKPTPTTRPESPAESTPKPETTPNPTPKPQATPKPETATAPEPAGPAEEEPLFGSPVPGKPGFVTSPYSPGAGYIDVTGLPPGSKARDPYTNKVFRVP